MFKLQKKFGGLSATSRNDFFQKNSNELIYRFDLKTKTYDIVSFNLCKITGVKNIEDFFKKIKKIKKISNGKKELFNREELISARLAGDKTKWQCDFFANNSWFREISFYNEDQVVGIITNIDEEIALKSSLQSEILAAQDLDPLTGTHNKNRFFIELNKEIARVARSQADSSIISLTIDEKILSFHEQIQENIIKEIAKIILQQVRNIDLIAYLGHGEFAIILPETNINGAKILGKRINGEVLKKNFRVIGDQASFKCFMKVGATQITKDKVIDASSTYRRANSQIIESRNYADLSRFIQENYSIQ